MKNLILKIFLIVICIVIICVVISNNDNTLTNQSIMLRQHNSDSSNIVGNWCLIPSVLYQYQLNYDKITFYKDSISVLSSRMDTVYGYKYYLHGNSIYFKTTNTNVSEYKIKKLTHDTLVFNSLFENSAEQIYYRCEATK